MQLHMIKEGTLCRPVHQPVMGDWYNMDPCEPLQVA